MVEKLQADSQRALGLPDDAFEQRRPLQGQITKREVRAVSLYSLGLKPNSVVWDIGAGTGSISAEASIIAREGAVYAVERDEESLPLLKKNLERWGSPNVQIITGEAPDALKDLADPDAVFVGGSGGHLTEILDVAMKRLRDGGRIVVNLAALERTQDVYHRFKSAGMITDMVMVNSSRGKDMPDGTVRLEALNPVFVVTARREG